MKNSGWLFSGLVCACLWLAPAAVLRADRPLQPQGGLLVLRNGEVLNGLITQEGDRYVVMLGRGGELSVPKDRVELRCNSLEEAYQRKRTAQPGSRIDGHLALADWCLRQSLTAHAADELLAAIALNADHPQIAVLERRMQAAVTQPAAPVVLAPKRTAALSMTEMEKTVRALPAGVVEDFTVAIQPLLLNRCAASTCHGSGSTTAMQLFRPSLGKTVPQRFTQRNLVAVLQQVNRTESAASLLLQKPAAAHGGMTSAVFSDREKSQYELLAKWVHDAADRNTPPKTIATPPQNLSQASFAATENDGGEEVRAAVYQSPVPAGHVEQSGDSPMVKPAAASSRIQPAADGFVPKDPFDAEIFNHRFHPQAATADAR